jgi:hypothetical protein
MVLKIERTTRRRAAILALVVQRDDSLGEALSIADALQRARRPA